MSGIVGRRITLTCRECGGVREQRPGNVRLAEKAQTTGNLVVDWENDRAEYRCGSCGRRANVQSLNRSTIKRRGRAGLRARGTALVAWTKAHPEEHRAASLAGSRAAQQAGKPTGMAMVRWRLGNLSLDLVGTISLCTVCHKLTYLPRSEARKYRLAGKFHGPCLREWNRGPERSAWTAAMHRARRAGEPIPLFPVPPRPASRLSSDDELTEAYVTTVRYFWHRESRGRAERDEHGQIRSITWLAGELGVTRQALRKRVDRFLDLLPDESCATGQVKVWREIFLPLTEADEVRAVTTV